MNNEKEIFLRYPSALDIVFVLGAGVSNPDGVPLQRELLPAILSIKEIQNSEIGKIVTEFINDNFKYNIETYQFPQLEAVFGFLDYFIQQNESLNAKYTNKRIHEIKEYLIKLIHFVVNFKTNKSSPYYHKFWDIIHNSQKSISIITVNYDTLLEQAFEFLFKSRAGFIDYCIPLMNYENLPQISSHKFWINTREPVKVFNGENPTPYKIIKLHGSLNWKYCNCCNQTLLTPWDRSIDLNKGKFLGYTYPEMYEYEYKCPIDGTDFQTLILPPSFLKSLSHPVISHLTNEAAHEIRVTRKIVFIGYSLSSSDLHIKALFKKNIQEGTKIIVINPKEKESLILNYSSLSSSAEFIYSSFENLLNDSSILKKIFIEQ
ncbi:SIR2 family protein [Melioribacteraceae bacterium 4301-Me]|uniref:SIR2 family protein n=1 Tax=Pyranulibacter aquaticus TaxID=3163344 RepID=UPI003598FD6A